MRSRIGRAIWAADTSPEAAILIAARGLRGFGDGMISIALPVYLAALGLSTFEIGLVATATLLGSAMMTYAVGLAVRRFPGRKLLIGGGLLMIATGLIFVSVESFWPIIAVAMIGTLSPVAGDASLFLPIEHARLSHSVVAHERTAVFARYSFVGAVAGAAGALCAGLPELLAWGFGVGRLPGLQVLFVLYAAIGLLIAALYSRLPALSSDVTADRQQRLGVSRNVVATLTVLFCIDAFAGGLIVQSLLALWLFERFSLDLATTGMVFFWLGMTTAFSMLLAPALARKAGLIRVMVLSNLAGSLVLVALPLIPSLSVALILLIARSFVSQLDVPTRSAFVMAVVTPAERAAAAAVTTLPRSLASAAGPVVAGAMLSHTSFGWPLLAAGGIKIVYNALLYARFHDALAAEDGGRPDLPGRERARR